MTLITNLLTWWKWRRLGIPSSALDGGRAQHTSAARQRRAGARGRGSAEVQPYTCSGNGAGLGLAMPRSRLLAVTRVCSFTARAVALVLWQNPQGDSHERWGFWAGDRHLGKSCSSHTFAVFLDTCLLAKQDVETRGEPWGCTSYLSTSLPTASWHERAC